MTELEIVEIAMQFGDYDAKTQCYTFNGNGKFSILNFAAAIRAATKEEDARICEEKHDHWRWDDEPDSASGPRECAAAIRASK